MLNRKLIRQNARGWGEAVSLVPKQNLRQHLRVAGMALLFALIQNHIIAITFKLSGYSVSANGALGVVSGHPYWKEFQSRVLAPYIILAISKITHNYLTAHFIFGVMAITLAGCLSWQLGLNVGGDLKSAMVSFLGLQFGFCYLLSPPWLYAWDYLGVGIFLAFVIMVVAQKPWPWFVVLFAFAILDRESGEFIALWMVIDPLSKATLAKRRGGSWRQVNWSMAVAGLCCLICGWALIEILRARLMVEEVGPGLFKDAAGYQTGHVFLQFGTNIEEVRNALHHVRNGFEAPMLLFPLAAIYYALRLAFWNPTRWLALSLVSLANVAAIFAVGVVLETRVYLELLPLVLLGLLISVSESKTIDKSVASAPRQ